MTGYISRLLTPKIEEAVQYFPVIVVTGPRQSGKTSLCRHLFPDFNYVNLEDITTRTQALSDVTSFIDSLGGKAIIDEVQNVPDLFSMIQVRVDEDRSRRYVLTGSCNFSLMSRITQSMAGRAALFTLLPFSFPEMGNDISIPTENLLFRGQYPGVIADGIPPSTFYRNYYNTYVERDVRDVLNLKNLVKFDTFIRLVAARCGSEFNASAIAKEVGIASNTVTEWLSILTASYITYTIRPYYTNISKRLTKMPKVYFYDTGLLCFLLGIENPEQLGSSMSRGAVFENMAMGELVKRRLNEDKDPNIYFYRESSGKEVDALIEAGGTVSLYEIKNGRTFNEGYTRNMKYVESVLNNVKQSTVIYDGPTFAPIAVNIREV